MAALSAGTQVAVTGTRPRNPRRVFDGRLGAPGDLQVDSGRWQPKIRWYTRAAVDLVRSVGYVSKSVQHIVITADRPAVVDLTPRQSCDHHADDDNGYYHNDRHRYHSTGDRP
jgi:hypothetical protein